MAAIPKEKLAELEAKFGLTEDGLSYQLRCSRIAAVQKGEQWTAPKEPEIKRGTTEYAQVIRRDPLKEMMAALEQHPLYGTTLLISPLMTTDKNRALYFDEKLGPDMEVEEVSAGALLYGAADDVDRISADYKIVRVDPTKIVTARTSIPKTGQEITYTIGKDLVPIVRGNDGQRGYVWGMPTHLRQVGDTMIQLMGLKTLIATTAPELLHEFSGKPLMMYVDGYVLAASIPLTDAKLKEWRRKELQDAKLGLV